MNQFEQTEKNRETIRTFEPLTPTDFEFMEGGTLIIHDSSTVLKPDSFLRFCDNGFGVEVVFYESSHDYKTYELTPSGWYLWKPV